MRGDDGAVVIPFQRGSNNQGRRVSESWWYEQPFRGGRRRYTGNVTFIRGAEGSRLHAELAAVLAELLQWAQQLPASRSTNENDKAA
ncbi:hypothetical protein [Amycolatopsis sp. La24]|uniref:hypothetical protein n=1 Tax=Amycolatopsis sp. La24 TaxID=3028304 RepID=UPI0023AFE648|nr:hypothetical protein [Amycolatopsis sp. La24]